METPTPTAPKTPRVDLVYGPSGSGKTTFCLDVARYIYDTTGKRTVWYLGDGGGETVYNTGWAGPNGFIDVFQYTLRNHPLETTQMICEGYLPKNWDDPTGPLLPPSTTDDETYGLHVFEGLTVMSDYIMGDKEGGLAWRQAKGQGLNKDQSYQIKDNTVLLGGNGRSDYGFTQRRLLDLIGRTQKLPGMVLWTAHERRVEDEESRDVLFGPDACGKALTSRIGGSFGNTLHLQRVHVATKVTDPATKKTVEQIRVERRLYCTEHVDPEAKTFVKYFANTRVPKLVAQSHPDFMPEYFTPPDAMAFYARLHDAKTLNDQLAEAQATQRKNLPRIPLF